ncbi:hypothetical protein ACFC1B_27210 [Streptomyces xiamenensis]|uniref:hypothetical protein n=1 Tax=Streptomyces xiamenensis TaxID=408015 RepID=UPI0035D7221C
MSKYEHKYPITDHYLDARAAGDERAAGEIIQAVVDRHVSGEASPAELHEVFEANQAAIKAERQR